MQCTASSEKFNFQLTFKEISVEAKQNIQRTYWPRPSQNVFRIPGTFRRGGSFIWSSKSSTEPLFFILCSCQISRLRSNHHHQQQQDHFFHPVLLVKRQTLVTNILSNISYIFPTIFHVRKSRQPDNGLASDHHHHEQQILNRHLSNCVQCQKKNGHKYIVIYWI